MATITINGSVTLDESFGLQNSGTAIPGIEDNNDSDVLLSTLPLDFYNRLFTDLGLDDTFASERGVAQSASNFITVSNDGGTITSLGFVDGGGNALPVYGSGDPGVATNIDALDGGDITLFADPVLGDRMVLGVDSTGDIVFALFMEPSADLTNATVWMVQFEAIDNPDATNPDDPVNLFDSLGVAAGSELSFNFNALPSGQNLFGTVGNPDTALVVIGEEPVLKADGTYANTSDTINTSQGGGPTTIGINNQMFDPGEGAYITFVQDPVTNYLAGATGGLNQNEADDADNIQYTGGTLEVNGASVLISQTQGNTLGTMQITAYDIADAPQGTAFVSALGTGTQVNITAVRVYDDSNTLIAEETAGGPDTSTQISFSGGVATVSGLDDGYKVEWDTGATVFDQVLIHDLAGAWDIGGVGVDQPTSATADIGGQVRFEDAGLDVGAGAAHSVDEDDLRTALSTGSDPTPESTTVSGSLSALATADADKPATYSLNTDTSGLPSLTSKGDAITYSVSGNTLTATADQGGADERTVFTLALTDDDTNGEVDHYQFALFDQLDHAAGNGENSLTIDFSSVIAAHDADGDTLTLPDGTLEVTVVDDIPSASGETESASVDEDDLTGLSTGSDGTGSPTDSGSLAALVSSGADEPATFSLDTDTSGLQALTSKGDAITYSVLGNTLTATADQGGVDERTVFTLTVAANGDYTFSLFDQLDHAAGNGENSLTIDFSSIVQATDFDGDSTGLSPNTFQVTVVDDVPSIGPISDGLVDFEAGDFVTNPLNVVEGADDDALVTITNYTDLIGLSEHLSSDGHLLTYFVDDDGTAGFSAGDTQFYTLEISGSDSDWDYTFTVLQDPPPAELFFNFNALPSGQNLFGTVGNPDTALVVIGEEPVLKADGTYANTSDTINTSQGGGPTTIGVNNQMFNPSEGAYITFVQDPVTNYLAGATGGLDQNEADDADNIQYTGGTLEVNGASVLISQTQGNILGTMQITAYDIADAPQGTAFVSALGTGTQVDITAVRVYDASDTLIAEETAGGPDTSTLISFSGGVATVSGLDDGYKVEWDTGSVFDQVLIHDLAGAWDIGGVGVSQPQPTPDQLLAFTVQVEDFDHDTASDSFNIGIDGTGIYDDNHVDGVIV